MQKSRSTDDITYADLGLNTAARAAHLQTSTLLDLHDDRVQYEEIQYEASAETPVCGPQSQILGNHVFIVQDQIIWLHNTLNFHPSQLI